MSPGKHSFLPEKAPSWSTLAPCVEHNSPPFDADGLRWVFKLFKGRARSPSELALYLAVHESTTERLQQQRKKVDVSFTLENLQARGLDYSKYTTPITVWVDSTYSTWGDDRFIALEDMDTFLHDDTTCLVVRFHVRETIHVGSPPTAQPSPAIAVYVPESISAPFNQLLRSARFSDIQFVLRDSSALFLSPGPRGRAAQAAASPPAGRPPPGMPRSQSDVPDALRISYGGHPTPPDAASDEDVRSPCVTPMPGNCCARALPYPQQHQHQHHQQRRWIGDGAAAAASTGPRYHAHRAILMAVSPVFEAMFSNGMRETYERVVEVWDVTPRAFERLLEYAYTHDCDLGRAQQQQQQQQQCRQEPSLDEIVETLLCADQFEVVGLRDICWRRLAARISADTVWDIWSIAADLEAHEQQRACHAFCTRNFTDLCANPATMWAPAPLLRQVLASDSLNVQSEEMLFEAVIRWASFREDQDGADDGSERRVPRSSSTPSSSGRISDEAVLTCHRSPSNLALLPRSPRIARPAVRRKAELTREAYTSGSMCPSPQSPGGIAVTRLHSTEAPEPSTAASSGSSVWSSLFARKKFLPELLPCIRFPMMSREFLLHTVERNAELMAMPLMKDLLIEAYRFHAFNPPLPPPPPPLPQPQPQSQQQSQQQQRLPEHRAAREHAKIILPLRPDDLALSRSQRRKQTHKINVQSVDFGP